jgi:integrase
VTTNFDQWLGPRQGPGQGQDLRRLRLPDPPVRFPQLGSVPLGEVAPLSIQRLYRELMAKGLSGGTILNLRPVLTQATRWGLIPANPVAGAQSPRPRRPEIAMVDPSLAERILAATAGKFFELPAAIAIATGMRRGRSWP